MKAKTFETTLFDDVVVTIILCILVANNGSIPNGVYSFLEENIKIDVLPVLLFSGCSALFFAYFIPSFLRIIQQSRRNSYLAWKRENPDNIKFTGEPVTDSILDYIDMLYGFWVLFLVVLPLFFLLFGIVPIQVLQTWNHLEYSLCTQLFVGCIICSAGIGLAGVIAWLITEVKYIHSPLSD